VTVVFLDTSAVLAVLDANDRRHEVARDLWKRHLEAGTMFLTTSYVLLETTALLQRRLGLDALQLFEQDVRPVLEVEWLGEEDHERGVAAVLASGQRGLSLVDCTSFRTMRRRRVRWVFAFDHHFVEEGFETLS